jgi:hypothetical protein
MDAARDGHVLAKEKHMRTIVVIIAATAALAAVGPAAAHEDHAS